MPASKRDYTNFFNRATKTSTNQGFAPRGWQNRLAADEHCYNRLIRIPTGEGKTLGALSAWLFHRIDSENTQWPLRLVWCLPMRTLVEQTVNETNALLQRLQLEKQVRVYPLMGGCDEHRWYDNPDQPAILVGTQDMLLSRALNRGYAMGRAAWPRAFGLLNSDSLWVMDEIQLMGVGLTTSSQIQSFFQADSVKGSLKPRATWWMSATLQPNWLRTPESESMLGELTKAMLIVKPDEQTSEQWRASKPVKRIEEEISKWANIVVENHASAEADPKTGRQTLVVVNTVKSAIELYRKVATLFSNNKNAPEIRLIHSRFRPAEREDWVEKFLSRKSLTPVTNRILIATQVVEAGVDISATCLITELAPWPSLVQRFGRAARYGGSAQVYVLDQKHTDDKKSVPYLVAELDSARNALDRLGGVAISDLEAFEKHLTDEEQAALYPFDPVHVLLQSEFEELFDTSPDLSGADVDVARFIREGDDRNIMVFWRDWEGRNPSPDVRPQRRELCPVPIGDANNWLKKAVEFKRKFVWDYLDGVWVDADTKSLRPGQVYLVHPKSGGYDPLLGFTGLKPGKNDSVPPIELADDTSGEGDFSEANDDESEAEVWKTICTHCREAGELAVAQCDDLKLPTPIKKVIVLALRLHDWGKSHPAFALGTYRVEPPRADLAKAPSKAWRKGKQLYKTDTHGPRCGFRHELASGLAILELLRMACPNHEALLDQYTEMLTVCDLIGEQFNEPDTSWKDHRGLIEAKTNLNSEIVSRHLSAIN